MALHSNIGASSAERWWNCPGSVALCADIPGLTSEAAAEGTVAHLWWVPLLEGKETPKDLYSHIGETVKTKEGLDVEVTEEMIDCAIEYYEMVLELKKEMEDGNKKAGRAGKPVEILVEHRIVIKSVDAHAYGQLDTALVQKGRALKIIDYKFGKGHAVEVEENKQMMYYAAGVMDTIDCFAFDEVELVVSQPRCRHSDGKIRRWKTTVARIKEFMAEMKGKIADTRVKGAKIEAGPWCRWCNAKSVCPQMFKAAQTQAGVDFSVVPLKGGSQLKDIDAMSEEQMVTALRWEDALDSWYKDIKARLQQRLENGEKIQGLKLVEGRANRQWRNEQEVIQTFAPLIGEDALYEKKLMSPSKLEKKLGKKEVAGLTFKPEGKKALALDTDPRPVAQSSAADDFTAVTLLGDSGIF
jgi:hypothetical protein